MKFITFLFLLSSITAFAGEKTFNFFYSGNEGRNRVYLACDYAEDTAYSILEKLGAMDIELRCSGGISPSGFATPVSIRGTYYMGYIAQRDEELIITSNRGNCFFETKLIDYALEQFDNFTIVSRRRTCFNPNDSYKYILRAQ